MTYNSKASTRALSWTLAIATVALVCSPLLALPRRDSFPLSTYPMFSRPRAGLTLIEVIADYSDALSQSVSSTHIGGSEVLQTHSFLRDTARRGPEALHRLCSRLARRLQASGDFPSLTRLRFVTTWVQPLEYLLGVSTTESFSAHTGRAKPLASCVPPTVSLR